MGRCFTSHCCTAVKRLCNARVLCVYALTFFVVLPLVSLKLRHTALSFVVKINETVESKRLVEENRIRYQSALEYLRNANKTERLLTLTSDEKINMSVIGITIISVQRNKEHVQNYEAGYLSQATAEFIKLLNTSNVKFRYKLFLCNVDLLPESHNEISNIPHWVPIFTRFPSLDDEEFKKFEILDVFEKEKQDYVYCLNETLNQNVSSVMLVQDDAVPLPYLFPVLEHALEKQLFLRFGYRASRQNPNELHNNLLFLKLYHPDRLLNFLSLDPERIPELLSLGLFLTSVLVFIHSLLFARSVEPSKTAWLYFFVYTCLVLLFIGRVNVIEFRRISKYFYQISPAPSCCLPAMFYTKQGAISLMDHLDKVKCGNDLPIDTAIDQFRTQTSLVGKILQPSLFKHIGHYSSIRSGFIDAAVV